MFMRNVFSTRSYTLVSRDVQDDDCKDEAQAITATSSSKPSRWTLLSALSLALLVSLGANIYLSQKHFARPWELLNVSPSKYAHLRQNVLTDYLPPSDYDSENRTLQDAAWNHRDMEPWNGFIALDDDYAAAWGLPHAQRWPWDPTKGVYILTASHELHCVRVLRESVNENHDNIPEASQTWPYHHLLHCLNVLRESIVCHADDTPLYTGRLHANLNVKIPKAGTGTQKMCRNWQALLQWERERSACYRPIGRGVEGFDEIERYKFCPDGSEPWNGIAV